MKKKILSLLLVMVLVVAALPLNGMTAGAEGGIISNIKLTVEPPVEGSIREWPNVYATEDGCGYYVEFSNWCDADGNMIFEDISYVAGQTYYISVTIEADEGYWWNQLGPSDPQYSQYGPLTVTVDGGTVKGQFSTTNSSEGSWATGIVEVKAVAPPANTIFDIDLGFTVPKVGDEIGISVSQADGAIIQSVKPAVTIPDGAHFGFSEYWDCAWVQYIDSIDDYAWVEDPFTIEEDETYYVGVFLQADEGYHFDIDTMRVENAIPMTYETEEDNTLLFLVFEFTAYAEGGDDFSGTMFHVLISNAEGNKYNTGGGFTVRYNADPEFYELIGEQPLEGCDGSKVFKNLIQPVVPYPTEVTVTAVPDEGWHFVGWYAPDWWYPDESDCIYRKDQLISKNSTYTFEAGPPLASAMTYLCAVFEEDSDIMYGDVNGDGKVNTEDALLALKAAVGITKLSEAQTLAGDVSGDGRVTTEDALLILKHAVGIIKIFPVEQ